MRRTIGILVLISAASLVIFCAAVKPENASGNVRVQSMEESTEDDSNHVSYVLISSGTGKSAAEKDAPVPEETCVKTVTYPSWIEVKGDVDINTVAYFGDFINKEPQNVIDRFISEGWKMILTNSDIAEEYCPELSPERLGGVTISLSSSVIISGVSQKNVRRSTCHEIGHFVDYECGNVSSSDEWSSIWEKEKDTFVEHEKMDEHNISTPLEFFAEIASDAILYPDTTKKSSHDAYAYVMKKINSL